MPDSATVPGQVPTWRFVLAAVSLANLLCLRIWASVLDPATSYFLGVPRPAHGYAATLLVFAMFAAAGAALAPFAHRSRGIARRVWEGAFLFAFALTVYMAREQIGDVAGVPVRTYQKEEGAIGITLTVIGCAIAALAIFPTRVRRPALRAAFGFLLVLSPFVLVTTGQTARAMLAARNVTSFPAPEPAVLAAERQLPAQRVVVALLDELDQFEAFEDRPRDLALPELDALVAQSVHYTRALSPAEVTERAIPSLLTGRHVVESADAGANDRRLRFEDGSSALFSEVPTFLSRARSAGRNVGLTGWFHPYCRVLGEDLARCHSRAIRPEFEDKTLAEAITWQLRVLLENGPQEKRIRKWIGIGRIRPTPVSWHEGSWREIHAQALSQAADPRLDVVFAHYPIPHQPYLRVPGSDEVRRGTYAGNLLLMDRCLGELRAAIRDAGLEERTALVVLADHPLRDRALKPLPSDRLAPGEARPVPMIVHLPGERLGHRVDRPVPTVELERLVQGIAEGKVTSFADLESVLAAGHADADAEADVSKEGVEES